MRTWILVMAMCLGACAVDSEKDGKCTDDSCANAESKQEVQVPQELTLDSGGAKTNTTCVWGAGLDCTRFSVFQDVQNRDCIQTCGAPSVCEHYNTPISWGCKYYNGPDPYTCNQMNSSQPDCEWANGNRCNIVYGEAGRCVITSGEP